MQVVIQQFANTPEPEFPGHVILEQYQAQVRGFTGDRLKNITERSIWRELNVGSILTTVPVSIREQPLKSPVPEVIKICKRNDEAGVKIVENLRRDWKGLSTCRKIACHKGGEGWGWIRIQAIKNSYKVGTCTNF
jgi:hypothetical protein